MSARCSRGRSAPLHVGVAGIRAPSVRYVAGKTFPVVQPFPSYSAWGCFHCVSSAPRLCRARLPLPRVSPTAVDVESLVSRPMGLTAITPLAMQPVRRISTAGGATRCAGYVPRPRCMPRAGTRRGARRARRPACPGEVDEEPATTPSPRSVAVRSPCRRAQNETTSQRRSIVRALPIACASGRRKTAILRRANL